MTAAQASQVGQRLLGTFLLVTGFSTSLGALAIFGFENPAGESRTWIVIISVLQSAVSVAAGVILIRRPVEDDLDQDQVTDASSPEALSNVLPPLLQLLGLYFVVVGLESVARPVIGILWVGEAWQIVAGEIGADIILLAAGVRLAAYPSQVSDLLSKWRSAR
jgi:hypothetical protein